MARIQQRQDDIKRVRDLATQVRTAFRVGFHRRALLHSCPQLSLPIAWQQEVSSVGMQEHLSGC